MQRVFIPIKLRRGIVGVAADHNPGGKTFGQQTARGDSAAAVINARAKARQSRKTDGFRKAVELVGVIGRLPRLNGAAYGRRQAAQIIIQGVCNTPALGQCFNQSRLRRKGAGRGFDDDYRLRQRFGLCSYYFW